MKKLFKKAYWLYFYSLAAAFLLVFYPIFWFLLKILKSGEAAHYLRKNLCRIWLFLGGIRLVPDQLKLPEGPAIICSNHFSELDIPVLLATSNRKIRFLGKAELLKWPLINLFFKYFDLVVDRNNKNDRLRSFKECSRYLQKGEVIVIFPEGGIHGNQPSLHAFLDGAFALAGRNQVPIIPVSLPDNYKIVHSDNREGRPGKVRLIQSKPKYGLSASREEVKKLKQEVYAEIERYLD